MIDYSLAKHWAKYVHALAIIQSGEDEFKPGDGGRAFGLLQMHPARYNDEVRYTVESTLVSYDTSAMTSGCGGFPGLAQLRHSSPVFDL